MNNKSLKVSINNVFNPRISSFPKGVFASDSFTCDRCGAKMFLKVYGDTTPCKVSGCGGTMHRYK